MCLECGNSRRRPDPFLELIVEVKGKKGLEQSLESQFSFEIFEGSNALECEHCFKKTSS